MVWIAGDEPAFRTLSRRHPARAGLARRIMVNKADFHHLLETPNLSRWPGRWAETGRKLVATKTAAAREVDVAGIAAPAGGVPNALPRPVPARSSIWMTGWLPTVLLTFDLMLTWLRIAAIVGVCLMMGLSDPRLIGGRGTTAACTYGKSRSNSSPINCPG